MGEATDNQIKTLETRMEEIELKQDSTLQALELIKEQLKKLDTIELGLFGNKQINYKGVIETQGELQKKIEALEDEIRDIKKINAEQDIAIEAKKGLRGEWLGKGKYVIQLLINMIMFFLLYKGVLGPDAFIKF